MKRICKSVISVLLMATLVLSSVSGSVSAQQATEAIKISELKVNNLVEPLGVDTTPRFRWLNSSDGYGKYQSAYQIVVASTAEKAASHQGDLWDSGKVAGQDNFDIPYAGKTLSSRSLYYWSVRVWDEADTVSEWSEVARFGTGIFSTADWKGSWIGGRNERPFRLSDFTLTGANWIWYCNGVDISSTPSDTIEYFRKHITVEKTKTVDKAYLAATCDDYFTLYVNGNQAMNVAYQADGWKIGQLVDISQWLTAGDNVLAVKAINKSRRAGFLAKLVICYTDGTWESVSTDTSWKAAQTEQTDWMKKDFADTGWATADYSLGYGSSPYYDYVTLPIESAKDYKIDVSGANWVWYTDGTAVSKTPASTEYFRKKITVDESKTVDKAYLAATCDDYYSFYINGEKAVTVSYAANGWQAGRFQDVTRLVRAGENILAAECTNYSTGWASFIGKLVVFYTDGTADTWVTDSSWKASKTLYTDWYTQSYDDAAWAAVDQVLVYGSSPYGTNVQFTYDQLEMESGETSAPMLRKSFELTRDVKTAIVYVCGLGIFDLKINGKVSDDSVLKPADTQYEDTVSYCAYDVTELLQKGQNAMAVELGGGYYNLPDPISVNFVNGVWKDDPKLMLELHVEYDNGEKAVIVSDGSWRSYSDGPVVRDSIYCGEHYDATKEVDGWTEADFDDSRWSFVRMADAPTGVLKFENMEPMRRVKTFTPTVEKESDGVWIVRPGEYCTGWAKIAFTAEKDSIIKIRYFQRDSERAKGLHTTVSGSDASLELQKYLYRAKGVAGETYEPKFSYCGYELIEISGYYGQLKPEDVECYTIASDVEHIGSFESGNDQINQLHDIMVRTMICNMQGKPTDTPVFEKLGWTGDYNGTIKTFNYNFDTTNFLAHHVQNLRDTGLETGQVNEYSPSGQIATWYDAPCWSQMYINGIYAAWHDFGHFSLIEEHFDYMQTNADYYIRRINEGADPWIWEAEGINNRLGDWASPYGSVSPTTAPPEGGYLYNTAAVHRVMTEFAEICTAMGKTEDAKKYRDAAENIYDAFNKAFYNAEKGIYETQQWNGSTTQTRYRQSCNLVPLYYGLCPEEYHDTVLNNLLADIESKNYHLDVGHIGAEIIMPLLSREGYGDIAMKILMQKDMPSWGYWLTQGGTTAWEGWSNGVRSYCHFFLGTYDEWFYQNLAGIQNPRDGYKTVTIRPEIFKEIGYVNAGVKTVRGTVGSRWNVAGNRETVTITVPVGTTADILLPTADLAPVTVNGKRLAEQDGILATGTRDGRAFVQAGSGEYVFALGNPCPHCGGQVPASGWTYWDENNAPDAAVKDGHYILGSDVQLTGALTAEEGATAVVDLNGFTLDGDIGARVVLMDSQTDDYTVEDGRGYGKITGTVSGAVAAKGYLMLNEAGVTSVHRLNLDAAYVNLRPSRAGIYYQNQFGGDEVIKRNIVAYGTALGADKLPDFKDKTFTRFDDMTTWTVGTDANGNSNNLKNGTILVDIMKPGNGYSLNTNNSKVKVYSLAYVELPDGSRILGDAVCFSLREVLEGTQSRIGVDSVFNSLEQNEQTSILEMYATYENVMETWNIPNIKAAAQ